MGQAIGGCLRRRSAWAGPAGASSSGSSATWVSWVKIVLDAKLIGDAISGLTG
jgi:hypothetical protein